MDIKEENKVAFINNMMTMTRVTTTLKTMGKKRSIGWNIKWKKKFFPGLTIITFLLETFF